MCLVRQSYLAIRVSQLSLLYSSMMLAISILQCKAIESLNLIWLPTARQRWEGDCLGRSSYLSGNSAFSRANSSSITSKGLSLMSSIFSHPITCHHTPVVQTGVCVSGECKVCVNLTCMQQ